MEPIDPRSFETQQQKLTRLSGEVLERYRKELKAELADPDRLRAVYGAAFADRSNAAQAQIVVTMASNMLGTPNAMLSIVLDDRQVPIAQVSTDPITEFPIKESMCAHVIHTGQEVSVEVAQEHPLVCDTTFARSGQVVSYLGVPVVDRSALIIGVLCVWDDKQRNWGPADVGMLMQLSFILTRATDAPPEIAAT